MSVSGRTTNSISVAITAPSFSSGLTGYSVSAVPVTGGSTVTRSLGVGGTLVDGLEAGKIYDLNVRSVSAGGNSTALTVRNSTGFSLPTLTAGFITTTGMTITFSSALPTQDCSYVLRTNPGATQYVLAASTTSQILTGLDEGTPYSIILDASNLYTTMTTSITSTTIDSKIDSSVNVLYASNLFSTTTASGDYFSITTTLQTPTYRNGKYTVVASSYFDWRFQPQYAFNLNTTTNLYNTSWYGASTKYDTTTGIYTGSATTLVGLSNISGEWIQIELPYKIKLKSVGLLSAQWGGGSQIGRLPLSFVIVGSNNQTNWYNIYEQTSPSTAYDGTLRTISIIGATGSYKYIRLIARTIGIGYDTVRIQQVNYNGDIYPL